MLKLEEEKEEVVEGSKILTRFELDQRVALTMHLVSVVAA